MKNDNNMLTSWDLNLLGEWTINTRAHTHTVQLRFDKSKESTMG